MALAGVAQWVGVSSNQSVMGSIPGHSTYLGFGPIPGPGTHKRQPTDDSLMHQCFSLSPFLSPFFPPPKKKAMTKMSSCGENK